MRLPKLLFLALLLNPLCAIAQASAGSPPMNGIAHVAIRVKDIAASVEFYRKLGFEQAFAMNRDGVVTQSFLKIDDRQFLELYPTTPRDPQTGFLHLCFEGADLNALHDYYVGEGLTPNAVRTAGAGNLLFTMKGPEQYSGPQNIEYTQYMPGSMHSKDAGQHLGPDRVGTKLVVVVLAMNDPSAAREFYRQKLGFGGASNLELPGTSGEAVEIVPAAELGTRSSIVLESASLARARSVLERNGVAYKSASASMTSADGHTRSVEMLSVTDPDGNIVRLRSMQ